MTPVHRRSTSPAAALAREVVELYGDKVSEHPVGTGPFKLPEELEAQFAHRAGERNPGYREVRYDEPRP